MKKTFNPLARMGFDLNVANCILTPGNIYLPLITENMEVVFITPENVNDYNYNEEDNTITITEAGKWYILIYGPQSLRLPDVILDLNQDKVPTWITNGEYSEIRIRGNENVQSVSDIFLSSLCTGILITNTDQGSVEKYILPLASLKPLLPNN